jgi:hypothetical protein
MDTETANLLFQLLYVRQHAHVVQSTAKITAVLLIPYPSMIGSADAGTTAVYSVPMAIREPSTEENQQGLLYEQSHLTIW